ncbi:MAG TPA: efflux RND transporter periplasmic adaptor subunit [Burkholderiales bacterium]|nr:efflux RND transporter periplasmic adaptor subunit [Burkholderiales bacterium]
MDTIEVPTRPEVAPAARRARPARIRFGRLAILLAFGAALVVGGYYAWRTWLAGGTPAGEYLTAVVQRGDVEDTVSATGTLQPRDFVDVGTQVSGQLKVVNVQIGQTVKAGDLLAEIDPTVYRTRVDAGRAQLRNLQALLVDRQAQLELARQQFARQENLMREDATTAEAFHQAEAAARSAAAQIDAIKAQIQQTESTLRGDEANLGYTKIYAPMSGTVVSQAVKQGQTLNANQQAPIVLRIADLSTMTVETQVSEADVSRLRIGMDVYFTTLGGSDRRWYGKLRQIMPTPKVVNNVVLYDSLFDVPNPNRDLMTQMTAQVFFVVAGAKDTVFAPVAALRPVGRSGRGPPAGGAREAADPKATDARKGAPRVSAALDPRALFANGRALVSVVADDGTVADREVQVGAMNRVSAQILAGLEPGERVAIGSRPGAARARPATLPPGTPRLR